MSMQVVVIFWSTFYFSSNSNSQKVLITLSKDSLIYVNAGKDRSNAKPKSSIISSSNIFPKQYINRPLDFIFLVEHQFAIT